MEISPSAGTRWIEKKCSLFIPIFEAIRERNQPLDRGTG